MHTTERVRDRAVNLCRRAYTHEAKAAVRSVLENLNRVLDPQRQRPRKSVEQENFERLVEALVCDPLYHHFQREQGKLHISRDHTVKKWRYRLRWDSGRVRPLLLDTMTSLGYLSHEKAASINPIYIPKGCHADASTIVAGPLLLALAEQCGVNCIEDFYTDYSTEEIVILKSKKESSVNEEGNKIERSSELIDYTDSDITNFKRDEMRGINQYIAESNIEVNLDLNRMLPPAFRLDFGRRIDIRERHLKRYFTCGDSSCQHGGRMFNRPLPFWMWMKKIQRRELLTMNGDYIAELDYSAMNPRLLYAYARIPMPEQMQADPYKVPGFERSRDGIKKLFNAMLFGKDLGSWTRYPDNMVAEGLANLFHPEEMKPVGSVIKAIREAHPLVASYFGKQIGHKLQNTESNIMVELLRRLFEQQIPALPVHDCVIVPYRLRAKAKGVMERVFFEFTGIPGLVKEGYSHRASRERRVEESREEKEVGSLVSLAL